MLIDCHTHKFAPYPEGIISLSTFDQPIEEGQLYSAGIHPWDTAEPVTEETWTLLETLAENPAVAMIGECGVDLLKGGAMYRQLQVLKRQVDISERVGKPLLLHCVKAADIILGLKRDLKPSQPWIIHGFRGKPAQARQLTDKGIYLSFGEKFNAETVMQMPPGLMLAETDESVLSIEEIVGALSEAADRDLAATLAANLQTLVSKP